MTINRSGSGLYVVDRPSWGFHTDDYFEVADHADLQFTDTDDFTTIAWVRSSVAGAANSRIVDKRGGAAQVGWR